MNASSDKTTSRFRGPIVGNFSPLLVDSRGAFTCDDGDYLRQQSLKGLLQLTGHVLSVVDVDLLEDGLIELSADNRRSFWVCSVPVGVASIGLVSLFGPLIFV